MRIITANSVDDLRYLIQRQGPRTASVIDSHEITGKHSFKNAVKTIRVGRRANLIEIKRSQPTLFEARLNPVDRSSMAVEADAHRQRDSQRAGLWHPIGKQLLGGNHRLAVNGDGI